MKVKEILLVLIAICTLISAFFSFKSYSTLKAIVGPQASAGANSSATITKKYAKGQTLEKAQKSGKSYVVFFYTDWCGYCKRFAPVFHNVVKQKKFKSKMAVAYVNCEDKSNVALLKEYGIKGFPTVFVVKQDGAKIEVPNSELFAPNAQKNLLDKFLSYVIE